MVKGGIFGLAHSLAQSNLTGPLARRGVLTEGGLGATTLAGGVAGCVQGYALSPMLLLKTRIMTDPAFREGGALWQTTMASVRVGVGVVQNEGAETLMKGSNVFALKRFFDWSTRYFFSDTFELFMVRFGAVTPTSTSGNGDSKCSSCCSNISSNDRRILSQKWKILASLLGGMASVILTLPLDVIVAKSQDAKKAGVNVSAWMIFIKDYEQGGWAGLFDANVRGFEARVMHVCLTTVVMKTGTGMLYDYLYRRNKVHSAEEEIVAH